MKTPNIIYCRGASLIEALIAAVIIGIGLLGIASLQVKSLQASSEAEYRAAATDLAWAMADRIRANLLAETSTGNDYVSAAISSCPANPPSNVRCAMVPDASDTSNVTQCTPAQMAAYDLYDIRCAANAGVKQVLPGGTLAVTCNDLDTTNTDTCDPGSTLSITISWLTRDDVLDTGSSQDSITMGVSPGVDPGY